MNLPFDAAAVDRMMDLAAYDLAAAGAEIERIPGRMGYGGSVRETLEAIRRTGEVLSLT